MVYEQLRNINENELKNLSNVKLLENLENIKTIIYAGYASKEHFKTFKLLVNEKTKRSL